MLHPEQAVSFSHLIGSDPWGAIAVAALTIGIVLEATWPKAAAVVNCACYLVALGAGVWGIWRDKSLVPSEHVTAGLVLYLVPVFVIAFVDVWLYRKDLPGLRPASNSVTRTVVAIASEPNFRSRGLAVIRWLWVVLTIIVLIYGQAIYDGKPNSDAEEVLIILMLILSFPASFAAGAIAVGVAFSYEHLLHASLQTTRLEMLFTWALFFGAGYLQWFTLAPRAWSKWKAFLTRKRAHSEGPELKRSGLA